MYVSPEKKIDRANLSAPRAATAKMVRFRRYVKNAPGDDERTAGNQSPVPRCRFAESPRMTRANPRPAASGANAQGLPFAPRQNNSSAATRSVRHPATGSRRSFQDQKRDRPCQHIPSRGCEWLFRHLENCWQAGRYGMGVSHAEQQVPAQSAPSKQTREAASAEKQPGIREPAYDSCAPSQTAKRCQGKQARCDSVAWIAQCGATSPASPRFQAKWPRPQ